MLTKSKRYHVKDMVPLEWRLGRNGEAHMWKDGRAACGVFTTADEPSGDVLVCEKCLISRGKCSHCGQRLNEEYECPRLWR